MVVLTFDDAVKTQRTFVAPLLKELGFGATFFVTHAWMVESPDPCTKPELYLTWEEIAELHEMGFEIGNHSWVHAAFVVPKAAARMAGELALVDSALQKVGVPRPVSYSHPGNQFGPEAMRVLKDAGYTFARRGHVPESETPLEGIGPTYDPQKHHRLLIPSTGVSVPSWTLDTFKRVVDQARQGQIVVLQYHGVPDPHPFASTDPDLFRECMNYLKTNGFKVIAMKDLEKFLPEKDPNDPLLNTQVLAGIPESMMALPDEMVATRKDIDYWLENMLRDHQYTWDEVSQVTGYSIDQAKELTAKAGTKDSPRPPLGKQEALRILPYPGGRHPRIGFLEGAIDPQRGSKFSVFLPWDPKSYVVVDLPEALFSNLGLVFLAHTHVPTVWTERNVWIDNVDWTRNSDGSLSRTQKLPNGVTFGSSVRSTHDNVEMDLWVENGTSETLTGLRTQICVMLKGAVGFNDQTDGNKVLQSPVAAAESESGDRWILTAWERCPRPWGNPAVPCMHADPMLPDCPPGQTVKVRGRLWFYEGADIEHEVKRGQDLFPAVSAGT